MRTIAVLTLALASAAAMAKDPGPEHYRARTAADLAKLCSTPSSQSDHAAAAAFCHGVLAGAYGYYHASVPADHQFVCLPDPSPSRSKIAADFVGWLKARPNYNDAGAVDTLFRFAAETFPCKR